MIGFVQMFIFLVQTVIYWGKTIKMWPEKRLLKDVYKSGGGESKIFTLIFLPNY